jgi:hypothetical protein
MGVALQACCWLVLHDNTNLLIQFSLPVHSHLCVQHRLPDSEGVRVSPEGLQPITSDPTQASSLLHNVRLHHTFQGSSHHV